MSNIIDKIQLSGVTYDIGGGGSSYSAGTGIDITNSVISISLPISAGTGSNSIIEGYTGNTASGKYSHAEGYNTTASTDYVHAEGYSTKASGLFAHAEGGNTSANGTYSHAEGNCTITTNKVEHASGQFNTSNKANTTFGDSGNTLFSVGNGTANNARHNAFEIRQNGDIYISSGGTDIKLQDHLGTVSSAITSGDTNAVAGGAVYDRFNEVEQVTAQALNVLNESLSGKQDTLSAGTGIDITSNVISVTGSTGGKAIEAGRGISVATGATADTISVSLPISAGTGSNSIVEGQGTAASGQSSHAEGTYTKASGTVSHAEGSSTQANGKYSHAEGINTRANGSISHAEGQGTNATNESEHASGQYNVSNKANTTFGNSGNTLFSVGNGTGDNARHNAFEIRQNGDIYISSGNTDIKLQDHLGGGSSYSAGTGIDITNNVISVTGKVDTTTYNTYTAATDNRLSEDEEVTAAALNNLNEALSGKQDTLSAGTNITIVDNVISAEGGSITIDPSLDSGSTNPVANSAITTALNNKQIYNSSGYFYDVTTSYQNSGGKNTDYIRFKAYKNDGSTTNVTKLYFPRINGNKLVNLGAYYTDFQLLEKSAVTSAITSSSTNVQVPSAKAVNDKLGGLSLVKLTQAQYDNLQNKDSNTLYVIVN